MRIKIKTTGFSLTPAIETYLTEKLDLLEKFLPNDDSVVCEVELAKTTNHHQKGDVFKAEYNLTIPGRLLRAESIQWDLRVAIDEAKDLLQSEIKKNRGKQDATYKRGARLIKKLFRLDSSVQPKGGAQDRREGI